MLEVIARPRAALFLLFHLFPIFLAAQETASPPEALHAAVRTGNLERARQLLDDGVDVNARDRLGSTPLLDAVWNGNRPMVEMLLGRHADVNAAHLEAGSTALEYAVLTSRVDLVTLLLAAHADANHRYRSRQTILHIAGGRGNVPVIEALLAAGAPLGVLDADSRSPLDEAVLHNQADATRFLISRGLSPNAQSAEDGRGPLHEACVKGNADLVPVLLAAGANPETRDNSGQSPLDLALAYKNVATVKSLLSGGGPTVRQSLQSAASAMENATMRGQVEIVRLLVSSGLDVNGKTSGGTTYLHDAALKGQARVAAVLLDAGARIDARNRIGGTPLHDAALGGDVKVITLLLDRGAAVDAVDLETSATPLMLAASLGRRAAVDLLLQRRANPHLKDREGLTALNRARRADDSETVRLLETVH